MTRTPRTWLRSQRRIVRYFVIALLFHLVLVGLLASIKIVSTLPKMAHAVLEAVPLPVVVTAPADPYAAYRDAEGQGSSLAGNRPSGPTVPAGYQAHLDAPARAPDVIGVPSAAPTELGRPLGPSFSAGDVTVGIPGIKGPGAALFGSRTSAGRAVAIQKYGATQEVEHSILAGLRWLKANQKPDGSWEISKYPAGGTALAVLCFLGHGETTDSKEFGTTVARGLQFVMDSVEPDGAVTGHNMYSQGLAMLTLAEGLTMTASPALRLPLERVVKAAIAAQKIPKENPLHEGGWRYAANSKDSDMSVAGWMVLGLKSAKNAGVDVPPEVFTKAEKFIWNMYDGAGGFGYDQPGLNPGPSAIGVLCLQFLGRGQDRRLRPVLEMLAELPVNWTKTTGDYLLYRWYYQTQAMFQAGDPFWPSWNRVFRDEFIKHQATDGHWDAPPAGKREDILGPVYSTTLAILTLEVYYRYLPLYQVLEQQKAAPVVQPGAAQ